MIYAIESFRKVNQEYHGEDEGESVKEKMSNFLYPKTIVVKSDNHNAKPMNSKKHLVDAYKYL